MGVNIEGDNNVVVDGNNVTVDTSNRRGPPEGHQYAVYCPQCDDIGWRHSDCVRCGYDLRRHFDDVASAKLEQERADRHKAIQLRIFLATTLCVCGVLAGVAYSQHGLLSFSMIGAVVCLIVQKQHDQR